jgi:hypothetical protein
VSKVICALAICAFLLGPSLVRASTGTVTVTVEDGLVTIVADNATPREVLAEWARVGGVRIVNGERVPGAPLTIRLEKVTERKALDVILRGAAGYMLAAREAGTGAAYFDRIVILPTSNTAAAAVQRPSPASMPPRAGAPTNNGMLGFAAAPTQASPDETDPEPAQLMPQAPVMNPYGQNPYNTQQDPNAQPANPVQGVNPYAVDPSLTPGEIEPASGAPTLFPGSPAAPGGVVPGAVPGGPSAVPGTGAVGAARPGEVVQPPTQATPYLNPYNIGARPQPAQEPQPTTRPGSSTTSSPRPPRQ